MSGIRTQNCRQTCNRGRLIDVARVYRIYADSAHMSAVVQSLGRQSGITKVAYPHHEGKFHAPHHRRHSQSAEETERYRSMSGMLFSGVVDLPWWGYAIIALVLTHMTIVAVTLFLHRCQAHRALELHPAVSHFFRCWLWLPPGWLTPKSPAAISSFEGIRSSGTVAIPAHGAGCTPLRSARSA